MEYQDFGNLNDEELRELINEQARLYEPEVDADYAVNQENYSKMLVAFCLLKRISNPNYDLIYEIKMEPRFRKACIIADFVGLSLKDESISDFARICELCDDIEIDAQTDGTLHIEILIKDVFEKVK